MERPQTGQDRSSTSRVSRLKTLPAGQRYAMGMPSYFSNLSMFNAKKPPRHHHDIEGKTLLAFRRIVLKNPPHRRAIPEHDLARLVFNGRVPRRGHAEGARRTGRSRSCFRRVDPWRIIALGTLRWEGRLSCRGLTAIRQPATFDGTQPPHFAAHLDLRLTVHVEDRLGHITQKVIVAVAMRHTHTLVGNGRDEGVLLVRHPCPNRLVQVLSPLTSQDDQLLHFLRRTRQQGRY